MHTTKLKNSIVENRNYAKLNFLLILYNRNIMKQIKLFFAAMLAMSLTLVGCKDGDSGSSKQDLEGYIKLGVTEFHNAIDKEKKNSGDVQILDYRSEAKYKEGHIPGAINIDASNAADWKDDNGPFMQKVTSTFSTSRKIYIYGSSGWSQTGIALPGRIAKVWGKSNTVNLEATFTKWAEAYPSEVEK